MHNKFGVALRLAFIIPAILLTHIAFCWGQTGHRVIAEIAQNHLTKKTKKEIAKLFGKETLAWWSNWADFIKSDSTYDDLYSWHFVNVRGTLSKPEFTKAINSLTDKNLYSQVKEMQAQLKDKTLPVAQRQMALKLLVHFMGDLAQPLHSGHADDEGGNKIVVFWFDRKTNLHTLWDSQLVEQQQYSYTEYARLLDIANAADVKAIQAGTLEDWFFESYSAAEEIYKSATNEAKLSYNYNYKYQALLNQQLLKGGLRLAEILNQTFD
jgi:hypothetical protein